MIIILNGDINSGFNFYGPFENDDEAYEWAAEEIGETSDVLFTEITSPEEYKKIKDEMRKRYK